MSETPTQSQTPDEELLRSLSEKPVPQTEELLENFATKREKLRHELDSLNRQYGGTMDALQIRERNLMRAKLEAELADVDALWKNLGGSDIDDAQHTVDELTVTSDATDHIYAKGHLKRAKEAFRDKFIHLHEAQSQDDPEAKPKTKVTVVDLSDDEGTLSVRNDSPETPLSLADTHSSDDSSADGPFETVKSSESVEETKPSTRPGPELLTDNELAKLRGILETAQDKALLTPEQYERLITLAGGVDIQRGKSDTPAEDIAKLTQMREALDDSIVGRRLYDALGEYAARKADVETRGGDSERLWHVGRRKRDEALQAAQVALERAHIEYVKALMQQRHEAGVYAGLDDERRQQMERDDAFRELYTLDIGKDSAIRQARLERLENRNAFQKGMVAVGKFLNGGKGKGWLRSGGFGVATGGLVATGAILSGVGWPITAGVGLGLREAVRYGSKTHVLDESLMSRPAPTASSEGFEKYRQAMADVDQDAQYREMFHRSRVEGDAVLSEARAKAKGNVKKFSIGYAAAGIGVHAANYLAHHDAAAHALSGDQHTDTSAGTPDNDTSTSSGDIGASNDTPSGVTHEVKPTPPKTFEFPAHAAHISSGEGWYHQFADMGMSSKQAEAMFADHDLMNTLVKQGAAYADHGSGVGGYGINLPVGGNLSPETMETIRRTMIAKGY